MPLPGARRCCAEITIYAQVGGDLFSLAAFQAEANDQKGCNQDNELQHFGACGLVEPTHRIAFIPCVIVDSAARSCFAFIRRRGCLQYGVPFISYFPNEWFIKEKCVKSGIRVGSA